MHQVVVRCLPAWMAAVAIGVFTHGLAFASSAAAQNQRVVSLRQLPLLFVDDSGIAARRDLVRRQHQAVSHPEPVIIADKPWEGDRVYVFGSVRYNAKKRLFEMWYVGLPSKADLLKDTKTVFVEGFREGGANLMLYATSKDGLHWEKPELKMHEFQGSKNNNIMFDLDSPAVIRDEFETDERRRYKMVGNSGPAYYAATSPDGMNWEYELEEPIFRYSDTITMAQDPNTGEFLVYMKKPLVVGGYHRRVVWLTRSHDFKKWSAPELVLSPDDIDDVWVTRKGERTEFYNMSVFPHAGGYIGLPTVFRVEYELERAKGLTVQGQSPWAGMIDVEIASSVDGSRWQRAWPRMNLIPQGPPGTFNGGAILGLATAPVNYEDKTWFYYTVLTTNHGGPMPPKTISIARAEWRRDGYVSLDAGPEGGRLETVPLQFETSQLVINADASRGAVRAAILEADGRPIEGLGLSDCEPMRTDSVNAVMRWAVGQLPTDRPVKVVLEMESVRLYSIASQFSPVGP